MAYNANLATRFPVYQLDFTSVASGKHIASTKRRIRWRFGFPNIEALNNGQHGTDCRGEEHEVVVVWSITSGKKLVFCDGQEVYSTSSRSSTFEHSWSMKGNHVLKISAHANAPMNPAPGYHQYDLFVDGQSYFIMPKVYELGLSGAVGAHTRYPGVHVVPSPRYSAEAPRTRQEEEEDLQLAIRASIMESKNHLNARGDHVSPSSVASAPIQANPPAVQNSSDDLLLDFNDAPPTANPGAIVPSNAQPANQWGAPIATTQRSVSHDAMTQASAHTTVTYASVGSQPPAPSYYAAPQPAVAPYQAQPVPQSSPPNDTLLSVPSQTVDDPFAPKSAPAPTYNDIHNQILQSYQVDQTQAEITMPDTAPAPAPNHDDTNFAKSVNEEAAPDTNTAGLVAGTSENKTDVDAAMGKLVNLLDINTPASELSTANKLTMKPLDSKNKQKGKYDDHFFGPKPTLGEMKALKSEKGNATASVMPTPTNAPVGAGALVVSGQQSGNYGGYGIHPQMNQANMNAYSAPGMQPPGVPYNNGGAAPNNGFQQFNGAPGQMPNYGGSNYHY